MDFSFRVLALVEANLDFPFVRADLNPLQKLVREANAYQRQEQDNYKIRKL